MIMYNRIAAVHLQNAKPTADTANHNNASPICTYTLLQRCPISIYFDSKYICAVQTNVNIFVYLAAHVDVNLYMSYTSFECSISHKRYIIPCIDRNQKTEAIIYKSRCCPKKNNRLHFCFSNYF